MVVKSILFPVDLSEASPGIVPWVRLMAEKTGAKVYVLYVVRTFEHYTGMGVAWSYAVDLEKAIDSTAQRGLEEFIEKYLEGVPTDAHVIHGYPAEEIIRFANGNEIDMIVIGTHGRKGLERIVFGSVAAFVVKHSPVPVLTVNPYRKETAPEV